MITLRPNKKIFLHILSPYIRSMVKGSIVVDIGCGEGDLTKLVAQKLKCRIVGIEVDQGFASMARINARNSLGIVVYNGQGLPFQNEAFSLTYAHEVIEHVENDMPFLAEIYRVLEEGGTLILSTPNQIKWPFRKEDEPDHFRHYILAELYEKLANSGFHNMSCYWRAHSGKPFLYRHLLKYTQTLKRIPYGFLVSVKPATFSDLFNNHYSRGFSPSISSYLFRHPVQLKTMLLIYKSTIEPILTLVDKLIGLIVDPLMISEFERTKEETEAEDMVIICKK